MQKTALWLVLTLFLLTRLQEPTYPSHVVLFSDILGKTDPIPEHKMECGYVTGCVPSHNDRTAQSGNTTFPKKRPHAKINIDSATSRW